MSSRVLYAQLISAIVSALITVLFTPLIMKVALRFGAGRSPHKRDVHTGVVPRWGGIAIYLGFFLGIMAAVMLLGRIPHGIIHLREPSILKAILLGGTLLIIVGSIDDVYELPAWPQLLAQLAAAGILLAYGIRIDVLRNPFVQHSSMISLGFWQYPITILWVVGVINAINWIDGVDGLAAGVCAIAAGTLAIMGIRADYPTISLIAMALVGGCLGFLVYNFNPAKIFMGGGALFIGFIIAAISACGAFKVATTVALGAPLIVLGLPITDVIFVIFRRFTHGKPIYKADKSHLHHRLLAYGFSQRQTVLILYTVCFILSLVALLIYGVKN